MNLDHQITIQPPPFTDNNGKLVEPKPLVFNSLNVSYIDNPSSKTVFAHIQNIPNRILLLNPTEYEIFGDYTQNQIENKLREKLGNNIAKTLRSLFPQTLEENPNGPGTILSGMFGTLGIKSSPTCSCKRHALEMNAKGNQWCEDNLSTILSWLKDESSKRKIPFVESLVSLIVKKAIRKSKQLGYEVNQA
jgi:hypothetical protein